MSLLNKASLIQIPSGYKDGTLYSAKPTNGDGDFTFSRGSNLAATRVNSDGLIEKGRENLLTYSNTFSNSDWTKYGGVTLTSGQADKDGGTDAWLLTKPAASFTGIGEAQTITGVITFSVFAKANTHSKVTIRLIGTPDVNVVFNLSDGTIFGGTSLGWIDRKIESVGNGWYKCSLTLNNSGSTNAVIYPDEITNTTAGSVFIQDAQLELGLVATEYIETTTTTEQAGILEDMPRLDYSGGASCPSLLLEPQRTNAIIDSEYFSGGWTKFGGSTIEVGYQSPEGLNNAVKATRGSNRTLMRSNNYATLSVNNVFSIYAKSGSINKISLDIGDEGETEFDLTDEWQRFDIVVNPSTYRFCDISMPNSSLSGDYFYIYGAMLETSASYPTSYIPTYGASVTRSSEHGTASNANDFTTNSCTLLIELDIPQGREGASAFVSLFTGSTSVGWKGNYVPSPIVQLKGSGTISESSTFNLSTGIHKLLFKWDNGTAEIFIDGVKESSTITDSSAPTTFTSTKVDGGGYRTLQKQLVIFSTVLSDDECIQLTTL